MEEGKLVKYGGEGLYTSGPVICGKLRPRDHRTEGCQDVPRRVKASPFRTSVYDVSSNAIKYNEVAKK